MILKETIDNVMALDIVEVIGKYVQLKRSGSNYKGLSPFTNERTPSFMVSPTKKIYKCFSSGKGGNLVNFIMEHEHLSYPEAIRLIAGNHGVEVLETAKSEEELISEKHKEAIRLILSFANDYYKSVLKSMPEAMKYITEQRQISSDWIEKFEVGYAPGTVATLTNKIIQAGYNWKHAVDASVISLLPTGKIQDRFRNRIMFPVKNITGNIVGFGGRYIGNKKEVPKYINSSDSLLYQKSKLLYGIYEAKQYMSETNKCYLLEGYVDVIMFHIKGLQNSVASSGTSFTSEQAKLIKRFAKNVTIIFDSDSPGIISTIRAIDIFIKEDLHVKVCLLPKGQDPDDFARQNNSETIKNYILANEKDFINFKYHYLIADSGDDYSLKTDAIVDTINSIALIKNPVHSELYLKELSRITETHINSIREMFHMAKNIQPEEQNDLVNDSILDFNMKELLVRDMCERKIVQYMICYGNLSTDIFEMYFDEKGKSKFEPMTVKINDYIISKIEEDQFYLVNPIYDAIYNFYKSGHKTIEQAKNEAHIDLYSKIEEIYQEEQINNSMVFTSLQNNKSVNVEIEKSLSKSITETILYYKTFHISELLNDEFQKEHPDQLTIDSCVELLHIIKKLLNQL